MNIILAEDINYPLGSFIGELRNKFPSTSIATVRNSNTQEMRKIVEFPPLITKGWLVLFYLRELTEQVVKNYDIADNVNVYVVRNAEQLQEFERVFGTFDVRFSVVNNLKPDKTEVLSFIRKELGVTKELAMYIANRHKSYLPKVVESVEILRNLGDIDKEVVKKYTTASDGISLNGLFDYIIGSNSKTSMAQAVELVHSFRFGTDYLYNFIVKKFDQYLKLYDYIISGQLSITNYKEFFDKNKNDLKDISEYTVKKVVDAFAEVSYDKLYYLANLYKREQENGGDIVRLVWLLSISER